MQNNKQVRLLPGLYLKMSLSLPHQDSIALVTEPYALIWKAKRKLVSFILILSEWSQREDRIDADVLTTRRDF